MGPVIPRVARRRTLVMQRHTLRARQPNPGPTLDAWTDLVQWLAGTGRSFAQNAARPLAPGMNLAVQLAFSCLGD
jgi:hypothetical protein